MSDKMRILSFESLLNITLKDYHTKGKIFEIEEKYFYKPDKEHLEMNFNGEYLGTPIGPAAGPHTQLAQNILSAYLTGSRFFELKTVQIIDGRQMQEIIKKPCIDARNVGYNVEWSTELSVEEAKSEYIKASVLLQVMAIELGISDIKNFAFNISVGYDLEGIQSKKVSEFIDDMKEAKDTDAFKECIAVLKKNIHEFKRFKPEDISKISSNITNLVTVSTLHGCKPEEILHIGIHLITNKKINTFIKCNPTLLGYDYVRDILDNLGYEEVVIRREDFDSDLKYDKAVDIISKLKQLGEEKGVKVGIKLTNTLAVDNERDVLSGQTMYLSGKPLYAIALGIAAKFAESFESNIPISLSGGIDKNNIVSVMKTGIAPVTFSTILLKPRGYINTKDIIGKLKEETFSFGLLNVEGVKALAEAAKSDTNYKNKGDGRILEDTLPCYDCFKVNCGLCVDVCPNRANIKLYDDRFAAPYQIVHIENRCNECDNCHTFCTRGGFPYLKKPTIFASEAEYKDSSNAGFLSLGEHKYQVRDEEGNEYVYDAKAKKSEDKQMERILQSLIKDYSYLLENK
jgi:putative selenate reductase